MMMAHHHAAFRCFLVLALAVAPSVVGAACETHNTTASVEFAKLNKQPDVVDMPAKLTTGEDTAVLVQAGFDKFASVFGMPIFTRGDVSEKKNAHVAGMLANLLDNDNDGVPDNVDVMARLLCEKAAVAICASEGSCETDVKPVEDLGFKATTLWPAEIIENDGIFSNGKDATFEEITHVLFDSGYSLVYPAKLGVGNTNKSSIELAMDRARGVASGGGEVTYPPSAWYFYNDATCDYKCMVSEYQYWLLATALGALDDPARWPNCQTAASEWLPCKAFGCADSVSIAATCSRWPTMLKISDVNGYNLITNSVFKFPSKMPTGTYTPAAAPTTTAAPAPTMTAAPEVVEKFVTTTRPPNVPTTTTTTRTTLGGFKLGILSGAQEKPFEGVSTRHGGSALMGVAVAVGACLMML